MSTDMAAPCAVAEAIVEEDVITRDTAPLFAAGTSTLDAALGRAVNRRESFLLIPSLLLALRGTSVTEVAVTKSTANGLETITLNRASPRRYGDAGPRTSGCCLVSRDRVLDRHFLAAGCLEYARLSNDKLRSSDVEPLMAKIGLQGGNATTKSAHRGALHKNVCYTGVEFGESSLIPQFPSETLKRKYGDARTKPRFW